MEYSHADLCTLCARIFTGHWVSRKSIRWVHEDDEIRDPCDSDQGDDEGNDDEVSDDDGGDGNHDSDVLSAESEEIPYDIPDWVVVDEGETDLDGTQKPRFHNPVHHTIEGLQHSAYSGCSLCAQLWDMIEHRINSDGGSRFTEQQPRAIAVAQPTDDGKGARLEFFYYRDGIIHEDAYSFREALFLYKPSDIAPDTDLARVPQIVARDRSDAFKNAAKQACSWLDTCSAGHNECSVRSLDGTRTRPTRLLKLYHLNGLPYLHLVDQASHLSVDYASLSHCWGESQPAKLLMANMADLRKNIKHETLPLTFRDTIDFCLAIHIEYLWIDSLCIIQDSTEDWYREALRMRDVYQAAAVNIAATYSSDGSGGLFHRSTLPLLDFDIITASWSGLPPGGLQCIDCTMHQRRITNAPLNGRSWVFQERMLSNRVLHFAYDQLWWSCHENPRACEAFPSGFPSAYKAGLQAQTLIVQPKASVLSGDRTAHGLELWLSHVAEYSNTRLTYGTDKLIAIAGVALRHAVEHSLAYETYIAGHWRATILQGLLWRKCGAHPRRQEEWRAPSWSWASTDGSVMFPSRHRLVEIENNLVASVLETYVDPIGDSSEKYFGAIKDCWLKIAAPVVPIRLHGVKRWHVPNSADSWLQNLEFQGQSFEAAEGFIEFIDHEPSYHSWEQDKHDLHLCCICAIESHHVDGPLNLEGLIVETVKDDPIGCSYKRIGLLRIFVDTSNAMNLEQYRHEIVLR